jgi:hypothetical protein
LRSKAFLVEGAQAVAAGAFEPDYRTSEQRSDRGFETSINWEDDPTVLALTLRNQQIAAHGVARLMRQVLDEANSLQNLRPFANHIGDSCVSYERSPLADNPFHGNVVFAAPLPKPVIRMIASYLAMHSEHLHA